MIVVVCPTCGKHLEIDSKYAGQSGRCNGCGGLVYAVEKTPPTTLPTGERKPFTRARKAATFFLALGVLFCLWILNDMIHFDVSKPISATPPSGAATTQMPPMPDALLEQIKYTVLLEEQRTGSYYAPIDESVRQALIAEYAMKASSLPLSDYKELLKGQWISWNGIVWEARRNLFWGYEVVVDIPGNNIPELVLDVTSDEARSLTQGQRVAFIARINSITSSLNMFWVHLDNVKILKPDERIPAYESIATRSVPTPPVPQAQDEVEVEVERVLPSRKTYESIQSDLVDESTSRKGGKRNLTSAQKYTLAQSLIGTRIAWYGWVEDVVPQKPGEFYLLLMDMDPPTDKSSIGDVLFEVPEKDANKFATGQEIYVEGTIAIIDYESGNCSIGLIDPDYQTK